MQQQRTISQSDYDVRWKVVFIQQPATVVGQKGGSKALPKVKLAPKIAIVIAWWSAARLIHYSFLNPRETITSETYAQKLMRRTANYNACSRHLSTEWAQFFSMTMPNHTLYNQCFKKFNKLGHEVLPSPYSSDLLPTDYYFSTTLCRENASTTSRKQKMLSECSLNPEAWMFML